MTAPLMRLRVSPPCSRLLSVFGSPRADGGAGVQELRPVLRALTLPVTRCEASIHSKDRDKMAHGHAPTHHSVTLETPNWPPCQLPPPG